MTELRLAAFDLDDLGVISAQVQDAVLTVADIDWRPSERRLLIAMNRFAWDAPHGFLRRDNERRRSVLQFDRVNAVRTTGIRRDKAGEVLSMLALRFIAGDAPSGAIEIVFAGNAALRAEVECIEARLTDLGSRWQAASRPHHQV